MRRERFNLPMPSRCSSGAGFRSVPPRWNPNFSHPLPFWRVTGKASIESGRLLIFLPVLSFPSFPIVLHGAPCPARKGSLVKEENSCLTSWKTQNIQEVYPATFQVGGMLLQSVFDINCLRNASAFLTAVDLIPPSQYSGHCLYQPRDMIFKLIRPKSIGESRSTPPPASRAYLKD